MKKVMDFIKNAFGAKKKLSIAVAAVVVVLAIILIVYLSGGNAFHAKSNVTAFNLKNIGELATQSGFFTVVNVIGDAKQIMDWNIPFTSSKYVFSYDGVIKAGIDFADIDWTVDEKAKTVTIKLPESKILSETLKEDSLEIYDERQSIFTPLTLADIQESRQEMLAELEATANENGLLEQASENAKVLLTGFLSGDYNPSEYSYVFE